MFWFLVELQTAARLGQICVQLASLYLHVWCNWLEQHGGTVAGMNARESGRITVRQYECHMYCVTRLDLLW
jgi:hypothetical protein